MSRSRSSPIAGPSRSSSPDTPPAPSYRIERYDSSSASDLMVTSRSKRSTAGNRLKALLDQELEKDEIFAEVENDVDFEANENEAVDIVDSDFDRDSDDDAKQAEDESEGERQIEAQEKADKQKRRAQARNVGIIKRPAATAVAGRSTRRPAPEAPTAIQEAKRRRISFAPDQPSPSSSTIADSSRRRSSARSSTVQSKLEVQSRLEEASQRRAAQPVKHAVKKKACLTQDALIAEALEVEEENRESLRRFLEQEEERRAKQRQRKERITGPFVRWMSVGLKTKVVEEIGTGEKKGAQGEAGAVGEGEQREEKGKEPVRDGAEGDSDWQLIPSSVRTATESDANVAGSTDKTKAPNPQQHDPKAILPEATARKEGEHAIGKTPTAATEQASVEGASSSEASVALVPAPAATQTTPPAAEKATVTTKPAEQMTPDPAIATTTASLTLDPVIAARQQAALLRTSHATPSTSASAPAPASAAASTPTSSRYELQARTLLSIERQPEDWEWLDEFNTLFGTHCSWDAFPFVPSRNRPLKPRQSICPITGLPAIYRDPRTGIAYGNAYAYGVITKLLKGRWRWTGGHYEDHRSSGEAGKGKKARDKDGKKGGGGMVGVGAVPPEMGIYLDDEDEVGAAKVWDTARAKLPPPPPSPASAKPAKIPTTASSSKTSKSTPAKSTPTPATPTASAPTSTASPAAAAATAAAVAEPKPRTKPGFDVVLTNALAPGDEKAVLAAALSLPAGSTRSGRRVQRS